MNCNYCHIEYTTREGLDAHMASCFYKENPLTKPIKQKAVNPGTKKRTTSRSNSTSKRKTTSDKVGE
ncbi:hypothetical protein [Metabacillus sp. 22489]|uniref:hypothetical protein n=1 Tax=Metabacillus sp. 22489 TaxID=3453928 RepID=UPI003F835557